MRSINTLSLINDPRWDTVKIHIKRFLPGHIIVSLCKAKDRKNSDTEREKQVIPYGRGSIQFLADFSSETIKARRQEITKSKC